MSEVRYIALPLWQLPLLAGLLLAMLALMLTALRRLAARPPGTGEARDWSVPGQQEGAGSTRFSRWEVRCKIVAVLAYSFMIASLQHLAPALAAIGISLVALAAARVSCAKVLTRMLAISGFIAMFLMVMPVTAPVHQGDTIVRFGGLPGFGFNLRGLLQAAVIGAKAVAITLLMEPLFATAPLPVTLHGLSRLGVPQLVGQMVLLSYRYLYVFRHEAQRMSTGMQVRGFRKRTDIRTLRAVANFLGMLLVRSYERTERIFDAMRARGYRGRFPEPLIPPMQAGDVALAALWLAIGAALVVYDRLGA
jgi:cobalt/nickel transport system permease protein